MHDVLVRTRLLLLLLLPLLLLLFCAVRLPLQVLWQQM
jgi:hypothetical protein